MTIKNIGVHCGIRERFIKPERRTIFQVAGEPEPLLELLRNFKLDQVEKWLN